MSDSKLGWSRDAEGNVVLTITPDEWASLLVMAGYAIGSARTNGDQALYKQMLALVNRLNAGNPHFVPYKTFGT